MVSLPFFIDSGKEMGANDDEAASNTVELTLFVAECFISQC